MRSKKKLRLVIDTNLIVAAYFNPRSASAKILGLCERDPSFGIVYTSKMRKEADLILHNIQASKPFGDRIKNIFDGGLGVQRIKPHRLVTEDPEDNKFLDCALSAKADYVITNDRHMLKLKTVRDIDIVRPSDFVKILEKRNLSAYAEDHPYG